MNVQNDMTAAQLMDDGVLEKFFVSLDVRPRSMAAYRYNIKAFFGYLSGQGIEKPKREHVYAYRDSLVESGKKPSTIRAYLIALRLFFRWASYEGLYDNIADYISPLRNAIKIYQ